MGNGYEFQVTFDESKKPRFYSARSQFRTIMPNLNYGFDEKQFDANINLNGSENGSEKRAEINASNKRKIIVLINQNNKISQEMLAEQLGVTRRVVQRLLKELIDEEKVKRVGLDKGGHWEKVNLGYLAERYGFEHKEAHRAWNDDKIKDYKCYCF